MASEQAQGRSVDRRVDAWVFGVLVYLLGAGEATVSR